MTKDEATARSAMKLALEALEWCHGGEPCGTAQAITALREALAQERSSDEQPSPVAEPRKQEPVAWVCYGAPGKRDIDFEEADINGLPIGTLLYTSPPAQRTWVGLTDEELRQVWYDDAPVEGGTYIDKLRQVEAKLKEKNT